MAYPPRGMSRNEAARYVGVGATKFDEMVADGRMPRPKRVDGCVIWDRLRVEAAFSDLPDDKQVKCWWRGSAKAGEFFLRLFPPILGVCKPESA